MVSANVDKFRSLLAQKYSSTIDKKPDRCSLLPSEVLLSRVKQENRSFVGQNRKLHFTLEYAG